MHENDLGKLAELITGVGELFDKRLSPFVAESYLTALKRFPFEKVKKAVEYLILSSKFMPKISEIIEVINGGASAQDILDAKAEIEWSKIAEILFECGIYKSFTLKDKAARKALETVKYNVLCETADEDLHWKKKDFIESYKNFRRSLNMGVDFDAKDYFDGRIECDNSVKLFADGRKEHGGVTYIGDTVFLVDEKRYVPKEELQGLIENSKETKKINTKKTLKLVKKEVL